MAAPILFRHPLDSPLLLSELSCGAAVSGERTDIENGQQVQPVQLRRDVLPFLLRVRVHGGGEHSSARAGWGGDALGACLDFLVGLRYACEVISDAGYSLQAYRILTQSDLVRCSLLLLRLGRRVYIEIEDE
jgi:hypothetical protein